MRQLKITKQITNRDTKSLEKYFQEISKIDMITTQEEVDLTVKIRAGDKKALEKLVNANLRFVVSVAKQYQGQGLKLSDLINEGNLGLVKAAKRFDETRGFKFISYAVWWIRQSILQAISEKSRMIRLPLNQIGTKAKIRKASTILEQKYQREPSAAEIAEAMNLHVDKIKRTMEQPGTHLSLDAPIREEDSFNLYDVLPSKMHSNPDGTLLQESFSSDVAEVLNILPDKQKQILKLYYGIGRKNPVSLTEIGELFNLTRERVRQIKEKGLRTLRRKPESKVLQAYL